MRYMTVMAETRRVRVRVDIDTASVRTIIVTDAVCVGTCFDTDIVWVNRPVLPHIHLPPNMRMLRCHLHILGIWLPLTPLGRRGERERETETERQKGGGGGGERLGRGLTLDLVKVYAHIQTSVTADCRLSS